MKNHHTTLRRFILTSIILFALAIIFVSATAADHARALPGDCASDRISDVCNVINGSRHNTVANNAIGATISGGGDRGLPNRVSANFGAVGGGLDNRAGEHATVAGGAHNTASGFRSAIGGGANNLASIDHTTIAGGENNIASFVYATIGGGVSNLASARNTTVAGGSGNQATFSLATIGGGGQNTASSFEATIGGGSRNVASGAISTIGGGSANIASGLNTTVSGGSGNRASGDNATIGGGIANRATDDYNTIGGGEANVAGNSNDDSRDSQYVTIGGGSHNVASGFAATIIGGANNIADGGYATILGGWNNRADARLSIAAGRRAMIKPNHAGTFLFADANDADFFSANANEFAVRAVGGARFVTAINARGDSIAGVRLPQGGGAWESLSDRAAKTNLAPVDGRALVAQLAMIPISTWNYKTQDSSIRHIGPMAQDFRALGIGEDDRYISTMDASGVALASIQGMYVMLQDQNAQIAAQAEHIRALEAKNVAQQARLDDLDARVRALEQKIQINPSRTEFNLFDHSIGLIAAAGILLIGARAARRHDC